MLAALLLMATSPAVTLFVSPNGNDGNPGSAATPFRSLDAARRAAQTHRGHSVVVELAAGTYRLTKPVTFTAQDSGNVTYRAAKDAKVILSGSGTFKPVWTSFRDHILQTTVPPDFNPDQLFLNGEKQTLARYPNEDRTVRIFHGYSKDAISPERVKSWTDPTGGYLHAMHVHMWGDYHYRILGKSADGKLQMEGGWQNNRPMGMHDEYRFVEGIFEELDAPGEWFLDRKTHTLYLYPRTGVDLTHITIEGPQLRSLLEIRGAKGLKFKGLTFQHTARTFMDNREPLLRSDWTTYRGGAVHFLGAENCEITDSVFQDLGGNAVFVDGTNRAVNIRRCRIQDVGANGVAFVGDPKSVRSGLDNYDKRQSYADIDKTPGPKTDDYPVDCLVEDCLITNTGTVEKQTAPVQIEISRRITVRHCSIYHVPRAGINIGDGCFGGHVIEGCDVFDTVLETGDHGSFNSWGRDRYWGLTDVDMNLGQRPDLSELDMIEPTTLRNNRWRCDHGWDIDLDDGSSHYIIENNLCLNGGIKNREGFDRRVENNIMVGNSFHPHVWFLNSGDVFRRNIVFTAYQPIQVPSPWGKEVDHNLLHQPGVATATAAVLAQQSGRDAHSLVGDAQFVDPARGDFRVRPRSPALALGFRNFDVASFGVRTPALRSLARTPRIGNDTTDPVPHAETTEWRGAKLKDLVDPNEISATGLSANQGVLVTAVTRGSWAANAGLEPLDVIQAIDGKRIHRVKDLDPESRPKSITISRSQRLKDLRSVPF